MSIEQTNTGLKIILVDRNSGRSAILRRALQDEGHEVISRLDDSASIEDSNELTHADVIIVNADMPDEQVFANLSDINRSKPKPIVMFAEQSNQEITTAAIKTGVNAYIVDGLEEKRVQPIIDIAIARFREFQALKDELHATRSKLKERKLLERAKGLLMEQKGISENDAFQLLRKMSMNKNMSIGDAAKSIIDVLEIL